MNVVKNIVTLGGLLVMVVCQSGQADSPGERRITLKQTFPPGKWAFKQETVVTFQVKNGGNELQTENKMTLFGGLEVPRPVEDGTYNAMWQWFRVVGSHGTSVATPSRFDTAKTDQFGVYSITYSILLDKKARVTIGKDGHIIGVEGLDDVLVKKEKDHPNSKALLNHVGLMMGDKAVRNLLSLPRELLGDKPVSVGDSWTTAMPWVVPVLGLTMPGKMKCTLKKTSDTPSGQILLESTGSFDSKILPVEQDPTIKGVWKCTGRCEVWFDTATGIPVKQIITTKAAGQTQMKNKPYAMDIASTVTVTVEGVKEFKKYKIPPKEKDF